MKKQRKVLNITIGATGKVGEYIHKCVQKVLLNKGFVWGNGSHSIQNYSWNDLHIVDKRIWQLLEEEAETVDAVDILSGAFDLDKWEKSKKNTCMYVDLSWVKGEANKVLNMAIQSKWFSEGYRWIDGDTQTYKREMRYICLYKDGIFFLDDLNNYKDTSAFEAGCSLIEVHLNEALEGEHKKYP